MESHIIGGFRILTFWKALDLVNKKLHRNSAATHLLKHIADKSGVDRRVSTGYRSSISGPDAC